MPQAGRSVTIEDVARVAGVSRAAVSKVIRTAYGVSPEMRAKVQTAIDRLGYRPRASARAMRGSSYTIGVEIPNIHNLFFPKIITGATTALEGTPYQLILAPTGPEENEGPEAIEALADRQVDGIITIGTRVSLEWMESLAESIPLVAIGQHYDSIHFDTLANDDAAGTDMVIAHLIGLGHHRIAHLTLSRPSAAPGTPHKARLESYLASMARRGLAPEIVTVDSGEDVMGEAVRTWLAGADGPLAVFAAHDELALGLLGVVSDLGLSAGQASVVGYDDTAVAAHPRISLTSVNQSGTSMGAMAIRLLFERISGRRDPVHAVLAPALKVRRSSAAPEEWHPHKATRQGGGSSPS